MLDKEALLAVPLSSPEQVFSFDASKAKQEYRAYAKQFHPDHSGGDTAAFQHVKALYEAAIAKAARGEWDDGIFRFRTLTGKNFEFKYLSRRTFELGEFFVGRKTLMYVLDKSNTDLFNRFKIPKFANKEIEKNISRYIPPSSSSGKLTFETAASHVVVLRKPEDYLCLRDVLHAAKGKLPPVHVAWLISRMFNIACGLQYGLLSVHADVSLDTLFVRPSTHELALFGGWWYLHPDGAKLYAVPARTLPYVGKDHIATPRLHNELVRLTGRELLGDPSGSRLMTDKSLPKPLTLWLRSPASDSSHRDFKEWESVMQASFGPRKFHKLDIGEADVYKVS